MKIEYLVRQMQNIIEQNNGTLKGGYVRVNCKSDEPQFRSTNEGNCENSSCPDSINTGSCNNMRNGCAGATNQGTNCSL